MSYLIFDTETTGLPQKNKSDEHQPHVVQLAAVLTDESGRVVSGLNHMIKPDGYEIPKQSSDVHGITTEMAMKYGLSRAAVFTMFGNLVKRCDKAIAHNAPFDLQMLNVDYQRQKMQNPLKGKEIYCTAHHGTDLVKLPPTQKMKQYGHGHKFKKPTLEELHTILFMWWDGTRAHDAMGDVEATIRCYFEMQKEMTEERQKEIMERSQHYLKTKSERWNCYED